MTAQILQEELVKEIGVIFRDDLFKDSAGEYIKMNVYEQNLPIRQDEDAPDPIPYVIVRVETGQAKGGVEPQEVFVTLLIGYFDDDAGNNGHKGWCPEPCQPREPAGYRRSSGQLPVQHCRFHNDVRFPGTGARYI